MADMSDAEIVAIRDEHLPSQGEPFDCIAFARAILRSRPQAERPISSQNARCTYCHCQQCPLDDLGFAERVLRQAALAAPSLPAEIEAMARQIDGSLDETTFEDCAKAAAMLRALGAENARLTEENSDCYERINNIQDDATAELKEVYASGTG